MGRGRRQRLSYSEALATRLDLKRRVLEELERNDDAGRPRLNVPQLQSLCERRDQDFTDAVNDLWSAGLIGWSRESEGTPPGYHLTTSGRGDLSGQRAAAAVVRPRPRGRLSALAGRIS